MATKKTPAPVEPVVLIVSKLEPARICTTTVATVGARAAVYLAGDPARPGADYLRQAVRLAEDTARAIEAGEAAAAAMFGAATMQAGWLAEAAEARARWFEPTVVPMVATGQAFTAGRKPGAVGPLRLAVRRILKRRPKATAAEVWEALKLKPPKGMTVHDPFELSERHITTTGALPTSYRRFANLVSEERPK